MATYQTRLFRFLLLVALLPVILTGAAGYYLILQLGSLQEVSQPQTEVLADYYHNYLFKKIRQAATMLSNGNLESAVALDFAIERRGDSVTVLHSQDIIPPDVINSILESSSKNPEGFVEINRKIYQYTTLPSKSNSQLCGGMVHNTDYLTLMDSLQSTSASQLSTRQLRPKFAAFLATLFVFILCGTGVAAFLLSRMISRQLAKPILELSIAAEKIGNGDYTARVSDSTKSELSDLVKSFNNMAGDLSRTSRLLAQTERVAAWREVARRFAHELKNPLQPILVSLFRARRNLEQTGSSKETLDALNSASHEVEYLCELANRFSHLAKLPAPTYETIDLVAFVKSVSCIYTDQLSKRDYLFITPEEEMNVTTDPTYFREIVHNLLQNALDATRKGERVEVRLASNKKYWMLIVCDNGIGMEPALVSRARLPYVTTKADGTGLGLAIVERSVSELGGQINIESAPGRGTLVTVSLPIGEKDDKRTNTNS